MKITSRKTAGKRNAQIVHGEGPVYFPFKNNINGEVTFGLDGTDGRTYRITLSAADVEKMAEFFTRKGE